MRGVGGELIGSYTSRRRRSSRSSSRSSERAMASAISSRLSSLSSILEGHSTPPMPPRARPMMPHAPPAARRSISPSITPFGVRELGGALRRC